MNIILVAIPVFFILIAAELIAEKVRKTQYYRTNDAITSLSIGALSRVVGVIKNLVPLTFYVLIYQNFALFELQSSWLVWLAAFVIYDFSYYWNHRFGHEVNLFWAAHVVHHSSEDYNLTTALRQSSGSLFNFVFFLPMALIGVDPVLFIMVASVNLVYQFWVHTQHLGKLGFLEKFLVTPSNHRVHHAQNQIYLDRNYGGVFIIWDRIFGSFQDELESEKPIYGVRKALKSWNPFYANVQVYKQLIHDSVHTHRWSDKVRVWLGRTGWRPADMDEKYPLARTNLKQFSPYNTEVSMLTKAYCILQYVIISVVALYLMMNAGTLTFATQLGLAFFIVAASVNLAWLMENKVGAFWLEWAKLFALLIVLFVAGPINIIAYLVLPILISLLLLFSVQFKTNINASSDGNFS